MNKFKNSQILTLTVMALLLTVTPFLSPSFRSTYLYFVINFLILSLGAEAGVLSAFSKPLEDKKQSAFSQCTLMPRAQKEAANAATTGGTGKTITTDECDEKIVVVEEMGKLKRCSSMPSLFFIGAGEITEVDEVMEEYCEEEEVGGGLNGHELFTKAEAFIGNFYKQLNVEREESCKSIQGF